MSNAFEKILERISAYELLNNIIPGTIYVVLAEKLTPFKIQTGEIWSDLVLYYFIGVIIGRIGSLVIEKFLKWRKKLNFAPYPDYVQAEQKDKMVRELSTINNMYRTYTAVAFCLLLTVIFSFVWGLIRGLDLSKPAVIVVGCLILMVIFGKSYIKQSDYVAGRVKKINEMNKDSALILPEQKK